VSSPAALDCSRTSCICIRRGDAASSCPLATATAPSSALLAQEFIDFHNEHRVNFLKYVRVRGLSREDAEDVVNDTFLVLYRIRERMASSNNRAAFGFKVLRDTLKDHYRRADRSPVTVEFADDTVQREREQVRASADELDSLIGVLDVYQAIAGLTDRQADCTRLHALFDQDIQEVARYLGITPSAVTSHLHNARRKLAVLLGGSAEDEVVAG
jgi:RNA polymerase sigma factor (sigma-70 family)